MNKKIIGSIAGLIGILALASITHANPSQFAPTVQTATATTSVAYMTAGNGTTTLPYDSYNVTYGTNTGSTYATNMATLLVQTAASSTSSVFSITLQYSQDNIDWYNDNLSQGATTTAVKNVSMANSYTWTAGGTATTSKAILIQTPTRYVRSVIGVTGASGAVWQQIVPIKEKSE